MQAKSTAGVEEVEVGKCRQRALQVSRK